MYRTPALNHYLTLLISCIMSKKVSLGKVDVIIEKGEKSQPLFMKEGDHEVKLIGKGTWGAKASACILTDKGTIGAYQLIEQLRKDSILDQFLEDGEFQFEVGTELHLTIANKAVVETRLPALAS